MVLATQEDSWRVKGWNAFYSEGSDAVDWVRPIYYDASTPRTLYVLTRFGSGAESSSAAWVYVDHMDTSNFLNIGRVEIVDPKNNEQRSESVTLDADLKKNHAITVVVNSETYPAD